MMAVHTTPVARTGPDGLREVMHMPNHWDAVQKLLRQVGTESDVQAPRFQGWFWEKLLHHEARCDVCSVEHAPRCPRGRALLHVFLLSERLDDTPGLRAAYDRYYDEVDGVSPGPVAPSVVAWLKDLRRLVIAPWFSDIKVFVATVAIAIAEPCPA